uniref:LtfC/p132/Gp6 beta-sandwich domain-containing protein n=2 Tax=unclassified bacterial viruses TaxID=12333 RepID=A0AAU8EDW0_9VIRU
MSTENRVVDIILDQNVSYGLMLQFMDIDDSAYPATETPVNLTGVTLKSSIKDSLESTGVKLADFVVTVVNATQGQASLGLTAATVATIVSKASKERDKYNPRLRFAGYYDVIMTKGTGAAATSYRVMEGSVYVSDGVTA